MQDVHGTGGDQVAEIEPCGFGFARCHRNAGGGAHQRHAGFVIAAHRFLEPCQIAIRHQMGKPSCLCHGVGAVGIHRNLHPRPQRRPCRLDPGGGNMRCAIHRADPHLDRLEPTQRYIALQLRAHFGGTGPAARGIGGQPVGLAPSQQLPHRLAQMLAQNVPQRDIHRRNRCNAQPAPRQVGHHMAGTRRRPGADTVVQQFPDRGDVTGIAADQLGCHLMVQQMHQSGIFPG